VPESEEELTNSPGQLAKLRVSWPLGGLLQAGAEVRYESGRLTLAGTHTDGCVLGRLQLSTQPSRAGPVQLTVTVDNLTDAGYEVPGRFEHRQSVLPQSGRSIAVGLAVGPWP
jgi:hypothetical protein